MRHIEYWILDRGYHGHRPWWKEEMPWLGYGIITDMAGHKHAVHVKPCEDDADSCWVTAKYGMKDKSLRAYWEHLKAKEVR